MPDSNGERLARLEAQIEAIICRLDIEFRLRDEATRVQASEIERVRGQQNEWRETVTDLTADKVERRAWEERNKAVDDKFDARAQAVDDKVEVLRGQIEGLRTSRDQEAGKGIGQAQLIALVVSALTIATAIIVFTR